MEESDKVCVDGGQVRNKGMKKGDFVRSQCTGVADLAQTRVRRENGEKTKRKMRAKDNRYNKKRRETERVQQSKHGRQEVSDSCEGENNWPMFPL